jgi:hypothetical protein
MKRAYVSDVDVRMFMQHLLAQHASLAHWDEHTMLFHADVDEFMVLMDPESGNLADLSLVGCLRGVTQAVFSLDDAGADECGEENELACFFNGVSSQSLLLRECGSRTS